MTVAITGGGAQVGWCQCALQKLTSPSATSKSKPAGTDLYVEPSIKQQSSSDRAEICLYICSKPEKEGICAHISEAGGGEEGRKASRISKLYMVFVNSMWSELGKSLSLICRELPPDCEQDFTFT